jgi:hypothetical protein
MGDEARACEAGIDTGGRRTTDKVPLSPAQKAFLSHPGRPRRPAKLERAVPVKRPRDG